MRILYLAALLFLVACGTPQAPLVATDVEITRPMPGRSMSAGFLVLTNNTDEAIRITHVTSPQFGSVELHETTIDPTHRSFISTKPIGLPPCLQ